MAWTLGTAGYSAVSVFALLSSLHQKGRNPFAEREDRIRFPPLALAVVCEHVERIQNRIKDEHVAKYAQF